MENNTEDKMEHFTLCKSVITSEIKKKKTKQEFSIAYNTIATKRNVDLFTFLKFI